MSSHKRDAELSERGIVAAYLNVCPQSIDVECLRQSLAGTGTRIDSPCLVAWERLRHALNIRYQCFHSLHVCTDVEGIMVNTR
jgi:hypothetical protein